MLTVKVSGMTCAKCVEAVATAVKSVPSVEDVAVDLEHGEVKVEGSPDPQAVRAAIADEGYGVETMQ